MVDKKKFIKKMDLMLQKYKIADPNDFLGFRDRIKEYVISLDGIDLDIEYKKKELFYEIVELQKEDFCEDIFNNYIMIKNNANKNLGQHYTPSCLNDLMKSMIEIKSEKVEDLIIFYEPAGGTGSTMIAAIDKYKRSTSIREWNNCMVVHQDLDIINCAFATLNYATRGINSFVLCGDTLHNEVICAYQTIDYNPFGLNFANISYFNDENEIKRLKDMLGI